MTPMHHDKSFGHGKHILLMFLTLGMWYPFWLTRWTMHKIDRVREAQDDLARQLEKITLKSE